MRLIRMLKSKIHRATVTEANLDYTGSITLDPDLMDAAGLIEYEQVLVADITNGHRLETYVIAGHRGTGEVCINGAAAHLIKPKDLVIIMSFQLIDAEEAAMHSPTIIRVDDQNRLIE